MTLYLPPSITVEDAIAILLQDKSLSENTCSSSGEPTKGQAKVRLTEDQARKTLLSFEGDLLASLVFLKKYALRSPDDQYLELTLDDAKWRWATAISEVDKTASPEYFWDLYNYFVPGGRQMFGLGNPYLPKMSLSNCYTASIEGDDLENIFETAYRLAKTYSYGGGQGVDISPLRPRGSQVSNSARHSTGAVSFIDLFSQVTGIIGQFGRRGALLCSIRVDHPDILEFIGAKSEDLDRIRYANLSVRIDDGFMSALQENRNATLWFNTSHEQIRKEVPAQLIWDKLIEASWQRAEPGILFWSTSQWWSPSEIYEPLKIKGCNACSEQCLDIDSACCLGSLVLDRFVLNPYTKEASFDYIQFIEMINRAVRHLDNVVELNIPTHPLPEQSEKARLGRRIGLGITGLADMFAALGIRYDSDEALEFSARLFNMKMDYEYQASIDLAKERGAFPLCDKDKHYDQPFTSKLNEKVKAEGRKYGQRNVAISTVPPCGSGSLIYNCSSGMEPVYSLHGKRRVFLGEKWQVIPTVHPGLSRAKIWSTIHDFYVEAHDIDPVKRVELQSTIQEYVDSAISSTINLPEDATKEQISDLFLLAYQKGLKGITVYRKGCREGVLLSEDEEKGPSICSDTICHKFKAEGGDKFYIHISYKDKDKSKPYQIFATNYKATEYDKFVKIANDLKKLLVSKNIPADLLKPGETTENKIEQQTGRARNTLEKLTRFMSLCLKCGYVDDVISILEKHAFVGSLAARLLELLTYRTKNINCPECNQTIIAEGGCIRCPNCGFEKCS